jgi:uncharacterized membrane protein YgcG
MRPWIGLALLLVSVSATAAERVVDFHSSIAIAADGVLTVTERIVVEAEGRQIRRGILRDFPTEYLDSSGNRVTVPFKVLYVVRNGLRENYELLPLGNGTRIRIGRADVEIPQGRHEYEIGYRTGRQLGHFADHDELYWNVNGNGWTFAFDSISADVQLPKPVPAAALKLEAYTGPQGTRGRGYQAVARDGGAQFRTTTPVGAREGLTIVVGFPKGVVSAPGTRERAARLVGDNRGELVGLGALVLVLGVLFVSWWRVGRDPRTGPPFPRYGPPAGHGPASTRYIDRRGRYDARCFAAALLGLASRGVVTIRETTETASLFPTKSFLVEPTGKSVAVAPDEELLSRLIFAQGRQPVTIGRGSGAQVARVCEDFCEGLRPIAGGPYYSRHHGPVKATTGIILVVSVVMVALEAQAWAIFAVAGAMGVCALVFAFLLPAYTREGRRLQDEIEGLRQYLTIGEKDQLARMKAPPQTREEFSRMLPYAVALDVEKTWADRFAALLGAAAVAAAASELYGRVTSGSSFSGSPDDFSRAVSDLGDAAAAGEAPGSGPGFSPRDSGSDSSRGSSSSGGSSGGGGGGGGGSGW